jgi:hypothetical protein
MSRPDPSEYAEFYKPYMEILPQDDSGLLDQLGSSLSQFKDIFLDIGEEKGEYRYAKGKWSIKELLQHLIDSERVFAYRALRFARDDAKGLPGFDENLYVETCRADKRTMSALFEEFELMRRSNILMFASMDEAALRRAGSVDGNELSARALGFICCGHLIHHLRVIQERYI